MGSRRHPRQHRSVRLDHCRAIGPFSTEAARNRLCSHRDLSPAGSTDGSGTVTSMFEVFLTVARTQQFVSHLAGVRRSRRQAQRDRRALARLTADVQRAADVLRTLTHAHQAKVTWPLPTQIDLGIEAASGITHLQGKLTGGIPQLHRHLVAARMTESIEQGFPADGIGLGGRRRPQGTSLARLLQYEAGTVTWRQDMAEAGQCGFKVAGQLVIET